MLYTFWSTVVALCRMIKIEHSVFALPFAYVGLFLASGGLPAWRTFIVLTLAMVAVRTFAMTFNRLADLDFDRKNPRTQTRPLVTGAITVRQGRIFCFAAACIFIVCCAALNSLCWALSVPALAFAAGYSYIKRCSALCHFWLGATLGLAPLAGWISVLPELASLMTPTLFALGVLFWVAGFDIFYSCQDADFDRAAGLHSLPANRGLDTALSLAAYCHANTALFFLLAGWNAGLGTAWYMVWALVSSILWWEHRCISPKDLSRVNMAFFTLNGVVSLIVFAGVLLGMYW